MKPTGIKSPISVNQFGGSPLGKVGKGKARQIIGGKKDVMVFIVGKKKKC